MIESFFFLSQYLIKGQNVHHILSHRNGIIITNKKKQFSIIQKRNQQQHLNLCWPHNIQISVITTLPNTEQSSKGKLKTHKSTDKISQQPDNWENRNGPDLVQAFLEKSWVESDFTAPNLPISLRFKDSGCLYNSIYNNTGTK